MSQTGEAGAADRGVGAAMSILAEKVKWTWTLMDIKATDGSGGPKSTKSKLCLKL